MKIKKKSGSRIALAPDSRSFGPEQERSRVAWLQAALLCATDGGGDRTLHDSLLQTLAYADSRKVASLAELAFDACFGSTRPTSRVIAGPAEDGSGLAGGRICTSFSVDLLRWLLSDRFGTIDWDWNDAAAIDALDEFLTLVSHPMQRDGLQTRDLSTREWIEQAAGRSSGANGSVHWLIQAIDRLPVSHEARDRLFDGLNLRVCWRLPAGRRPAMSRTFLRFPARPLFEQREPLLRAIDLQSQLARKLPPRARLTTSQSRALIGTARGTLAVRGRETDPVTYASPAEVELFRLERGVDVALFGMTPQRRLPIESYFGFVAARNRVPIAYGGGWVLLDRCEIGVNLFEEFRGGESAFIFAQIMRVYARHYQVRRFTVDPFQFGADNEEAIQSGAYWFYDRLGFRPTSPTLRRLADSERGRIAASTGYRSPPRVLRRLAGGPIALEAHSDDQRATGKTPPGETHVDLVRVGLAVSKWMSARPERPQTVGAARANRHLRDSFNLGGRNDASLALAVEHFRPLLAMAVERDAWTPAQRRMIRSAILAKHGPRERDYVFALRACEPLRKLLIELSAGSD